MSKEDRPDELPGRIDAIYWSALAAAREALTQRAAGVDGETVRTPYPLPIIRAGRDDYAEIIRLWREHHGNAPISIDLPPRDCPACGSRHHRMHVVSHDLYPFHVCADCATLFVAHPVEEDFIERFLTAVPQARAIADRMMAGRDRETLQSDHERFDAYFALADRLMEGPATGRHYLDIGCGVGHSVDAAAARGYEAVGLEISRTALATARARGRNCHHPDKWTGNTTFDLISLFETLEHVSDPLAMLRDAASRMRDNGLMLVTVPNGASWEVSLLPDRSVHVYGGFDGVGHINLMTPQGLASLLRRAGLEPLMFDGQFGNNAQLLASAILDRAQPALSPAGDGEIELAVPAAIDRLLNSAGPLLTVLDRSTLRSPILIVAACRTQDADAYRARSGGLEADRLAEILASLPPEPAAPPPPPAPKVAMPQDVPLFSEGASLVANVIDASLASAFQRSGINADVRSGLSVRSYRPLNFDTVLKLGEGKLRAGRYEFAAAALIRAGAAALGVLDEAKGEWVTIANIDPAEYFTRLPFEIDATTKVSLFITANNVEPAEVDLELFDLGLAKVG